MTTPAPREPKPFFFDLFDLLENPFASLRPFGGQGIRVEEGIEDDRYVLRAELPGIDPDKDLEISVTRGLLTIRAERQEERREGRRRSEFRYGAYERHLRLPEGFKDEEIKATYDKGILTVTIPLREPKEAAKRITVEH